MSKTTKTHNVALVLTSEQEALMLRAVATMHEIVASGPHGDPLPNFDACGVAEYGRILGRAFEALGATEGARRAERERIFREKIQGVLNTHIEAHRKVVEQFNAELATMSEPIRQIVLASGKMPDAKVVKVPVSHILPKFPTGTTVEQVVRKLTTFDFDVKGKGDATYIRIEL